MKRCKHCGKTKALDEFYTDRKAKDGRRPECKACNLAARARKYAADPQPYIARVKKWQQENAGRLCCVSGATTRSATFARSASSSSGRPTISIETTSLRRSPGIACWP